MSNEPVAPAPDETTVLTPLIYLPPGAAIESYAWRFCPFPGPANDGYPCLITEEELAGLAGGDAAAVPSFDLGGEATASFQHSLDPALLEVLCEGTAEAPAAVDCAGGFPAQVKLTVRTATEEVSAVRPLRLRLDSAGERNQNPSIDQLVAVVDGEERALDDMGGVTLQRSEETVVRATLSGDVAERYTSVDADGEPTERRERLVFTWFVESGDTDSERTGFIEDAVPLSEALENTWEPAPEDEYERDEARLVVIIRDDRGGIAWEDATVALEAAP